MSDESVQSGLAKTTSQYQTRVTLLAGAVTAGQLVLKADPRRWYLMVWGESMGPQMSPVMPGPAIPLGAMVPTITAPLEWKYRDCPSIVAGEFYAPYASGTGFLFIEVLFLG